MAKHHTGATTEPLRHDIDRGRTGDKASGIDPAVAPLGTDEEAAGTPISPKLLAVVRRREQKRRENAARPSQGGVVIWLVIVIGLAIGVGIGLLLAT